MNDIEHRSSVLCRSTACSEEVEGRPDRQAPQLFHCPPSPPGAPPQACGFWKAQGRRAGVSREDLVATAPLRVAGAGEKIQLMQRLTGGEPFLAVASEHCCLLTHPPGLLRIPRQRLVRRSAAYCTGTPPAEKREYCWAREFCPGAIASASDQLSLGDRDVRWKRRRALDASARGQPLMDI